MTIYQHKGTLRSISRMLAEVMDALDTGSDQCAKCGKSRYRNWNHREAHQALSAAQGRVEKALRFLEEEK